MNEETKVAKKLLETMNDDYYSREDNKILNRTSEASAYAMIGLAQMLDKQSRVMTIQSWIMIGLTILLIVATAINVIVIF